MTTLTWPPAYDTAIEHELFLLGYRNLTVHVVGHVGLSLLVAAGTWFAVPHTLVLGWLAWMLCLALILCLGVWAFRWRINTPGTDALALRQWKNMHVWMVTLPGIGWGSIGLLFVPGAQVNNLLVMTSFAGALAYSSVSNAHDLRGFVVSVTLASILLLSQIPAVFGDQSLAVIGMILLYLSVMAWVARNAHLTLIESIQLRLANEILAQKNAGNATRAEQANRDKSEFLAAASHDLRQPVHALLLLIEAYRQQVPSAASHPLVLNIAAAGQSISSLFNALMELSRLESGMEKPVLAAFDLSECKARLLARMRPEAERKGLGLRSRVSKRAAHLSLCTDKLLLERMLGNLLANAVCYTEQGGVLLSLRPAHRDSGYWLEVWDTGLGIAVADQARIFDPYVQLANRERDRTKGLGLGLAIVRHASDLLGIGVSLQTCLGRGSCFRMHLPAAMCVTWSEHVPAPATVPLPSMVHPSCWLAGRRLLLVDDDPMIQRAMQALLGSWGMALRVAGSGDATALEACGPDWEPECVLCDFRLPGTLDGIAMLDFLQERYPQAVGILQTGELAQTVQVRAEEAGYMVLFKPVDAAVLASTLATVLNRRKLERG
ncbi:MAG: hybrid sensor histidine kinase/response regulator [Rhodoferax sp.]|uniref:ATP-binding response regulator n=1 Tax=Rhodoferax sp. TaxID=50421 RepID=UPI002736EC7A|nr:hybrid sensor histidine kinase/response regulator [Rhodoferax sp.]MDP2678780.1 hybrid sensor histidine kinase/response regulator [Rhodoferax sp.]